MNFDTQVGHVRPKDLEQVILELKSSLARLDYLSAIELAQSGDLSSAENLLRKLIQEDPTEENYDLLARVLAQQERFDEAKEMWDQILLQNPNHKNARAAVNKIESRKRKQGNKFQLTPYLGWLVSIVALVFLLGISLDIGRTARSIAEIGTKLDQQATVSILQERSMNSQELLETISSQIENQAEKVSNETILEIMSLNGEIQGLATQVASLEFSLNKTLTPTPNSSYLDINIDVPGVQTIYVENSLKLIFENGLFKYDQALSEEGKRTLTNLAYQIEPHVGKFEISVYGFTDNTEQNIKFLDLQRALAVVKHITLTSQIPASVFSIRDAGDLPAPYPNNSYENRMRNRTVMLIITKRIQSEE
ncbi:MAG: tetratricopeptide repeat protein [Anaerolineales bacterium]